MAQQEPPQHHHHDHGEPSSISSPRQIGSSPPPSPPSPSSPSTNTEQPSSLKITINADHYAMLLNNATTLWNETNQRSDFSDLESKPNDNTILHIAASVGQLDFIDLIIGRNHHLLNLPNLKGDRPVHVAAWACQLKAVEKLVFWAGERGELSTMLEMVNKDNNTALHIALLNQQEKMAKFLFEKWPKTFYYLNNEGFSPLYLAIKAQFWELAKGMLLKNLSVEVLSEADEKLRQGKSVVHAAILAKKKDIFQMMLGVGEHIKYKDIEYTVDEMQRTPLSYAAYTGFLEGVKYMFTTNPNQAFRIDENGYFPIHWACGGGNIKIVEIFFSKLAKQTRFLLSNNRQNILHVAAANGKAEVVKYILQQPELETLINMKDEDGNTPLHLASMGKHPKGVYALTWDDRVNLTLQNNLGLTALDIAEKYYDDIPSFEERLTWLSLRYVGASRSSQLHLLYFNINILDTTDPRNATNPDTCGQDNNTSPAASALLGQQRDPLKIHHKMKRKHESEYKERINTLLLVSILVTTVTYASGFTVPGGYNNNAPNEGMATLAHKHAFQVFVISNTIAMYTSILAAVTLIWAHLDDIRLVMLSLNLALLLLGTSLAMMSVAFTAGLYVVLYNVVSWLGIVVLAMGGLFLGALMVLFIPLYSPTSCVTSKILRYIIHVPFTIMLLACEN